MMNFVESFNLLGVDARQIPCIKCKGAPTTATEGAVGCLAIDEDTKDIYKCTSVENGEYVWEQIFDKQSIYNEIDKLASGETVIDKNYFADWTIGRMSSGTHANSTQHAYTPVFKNDGQVIHFDNEQYKIMFIKYDAGGNFIAHSSWITQTPYTVPASYEFFSLEVNHLTSSADTDYLSQSVYYETDGTSALVKKVLDVEKKVKPCCYVDGESGNDENDGTKERPFKTIQKGVDENTNIVYVATGNYTGNVSVSNRDDITIMPITYPSAHDPAYPDTPKIKINGGTLTVSDCGNVKIVGVHCDNAAKSLFSINRVKNAVFIDCIASNSTGESTCGFKTISANATFTQCIAHNVVLDGFNMHGYGNVDLYNCTAHDCGDDGVSHHDGCTGSVIGGEFYNCGKGGVSSPTYGAYVDVHNVYSHDNAYGLYALSSDTNRNSKGKISNCVFKNNTTYDVMARNCNIDAWNIIYDTKSTTGTAVLTEFN